MSHLRGPDAHRRRHPHRLLPAVCRRHRCHPLWRRQAIPFLARRLGNPGSGPLPVHVPQRGRLQPDHHRLLHPDPARAVVPGLLRLHRPPPPRPRRRPQDLCQVRRRVSRPPPAVPTSPRHRPRRRPRARLLGRPQGLRPPRRRRGSRPRLRRRLRDPQSSHHALRLALAQPDRGGPAIRRGARKRPPALRHRRRCRHHRRHHHHRLQPRADLRDRRGAHAR
ncbi:hypothetical protein VTK26DRAFT_8998 [Humicola hyalothermophila]